MYDFHIHIKKHIRSYSSKKVMLVICLFIQMNTIISQTIKKIYHQSYSVNEGLLVNMVVDFIQDDYGFYWISSGAGLQRFDGKNFKTINKSKDLPETNHPRFFKLKDGRIWLSYHKGISEFNPHTNQFKLIIEIPKELLSDKSSPKQYEINPITPVSETANAIWCWSTSESRFIKIDKNNHHIIDDLLVHQSSEMIISTFHQDNKGDVYFLNKSNEIQSINFNTKKVNDILSFTNIQEPIYDFDIYQDKILSLSTKHIYETSITEKKTKIFCRHPNKIRINNVEINSIKIISNKRCAVSINKQLYLVDLETKRYSYQLLNMNMEPFIKNGDIKYCFTDNNDFLWIISIAEGIKKIDLHNLQINIINNQRGKNNFVKSIYTDINDNIILSGKLYNEIDIYDQLGNLIHELKLPFHSVAAQIVDFKKIGKNEYLVFASGKHSIYKINTRKFTIKPITDHFRIDYYSRIQETADNRTILFSSNDISEIDFSNGKLNFKNLIKNEFYLCGLIDNDNKIWLGATGKYSVFFGKNYSQKKTFQLPENIVTKSIYDDRKGNIWIGTEKGLFKIAKSTGSIIHVYSLESGLSNETIYSLLADRNGNIWMGTNKGISCLLTDQTIFNLFPSAGLQGNEFNMNSCHLSQNGMLYFGGTDGISSFNPQIVYGKNHTYDVFISDMKINDADFISDIPYYKVKHISLPYYNNILSFTLTSQRSFSQNDMIYQYKMQGVDHKWINSMENGYARYSLSPGHYTFQYAASNVFSNFPKQIKSLEIDIVAPSWQKPLYRAIFIIIIFIVIYYFIYLLNRRKIEKSREKIQMMDLIKSERERISRDLHDNVGAYTTVMIHNVQNMLDHSKDKQSSIMASEILENAHSIIDSMQETIWVLNNTSITITSFIDRFKLYTKRIMKGYHSIWIKYSEIIENDIILTPAEALHLFRIMQEVIQNSLKHSKSTEILIHTHSSQYLEICMSDKGIGFIPELNSVGNGLKNMKFRASEIGYEINISSGSTGTTIILSKKS